MLCRARLSNRQPAVWSHDIVERDGRGVRRDPVAIDTDYNVVAVGKPFYFIIYWFNLFFSVFCYHLRSPVCSLLHNKVNK